MGAWGFSPTDCDGGDEWIFSLWKNYPFQSEVERTLQLHVEDHHEAVRAAAFVLRGTRDLFVWDPDDYTRLSTLAIGKLEGIRRMEIYHDVDFQEALVQEIQQLRAES